MVRLKVEIENKADVKETIKPLFQGTSPGLHTHVPLEAQASLARLLANESISRAPRVRAVLKFMIDALQEGKAETINEQVVGEAVFDRPTGYNPAEDNIVRVTIRHLRDRLEEFYRKEGCDEKYILTIPKGRYVPVLSSPQSRQPASTSLVREPPHILTSDDPEEPSGVTAAALIPYTLTYTLPWILVGLLAVTVGVLGFRLHRQANTSSPTAMPAHRQVGFLSLLLANGKPTTVVVSDSNIQAYRMIFRKTVPLSAYIDRSYLRSASDFPEDSPTHGVWAFLGATGQTSMTSMLVETEIQAASVPDVIKTKYPRDLNMRDIEHGNFIFLGGPWIDPWEQLFEDHLNFRIVPLVDAPWRSNIHNLKPLGSEPTLFSSQQRGSSTVSYVRFALLRNLSNDGYIVLLGGTTEVAVEAGAKFLMSESQMSTLLKSFKVSSLQELPSIEVVIETTGLQEVPEDFRVVAERVVNTQ
jgi:hypothetical protein